MQTTREYRAQIDLHGYILLALGVFYSVLFLIIYHMDVVMKEKPGETPEQRLAVQRRLIYFKLFLEATAIILKAAALIYCGITGFKGSVDSAIIVGVLLQGTVSSVLVLRQMWGIFGGSKIFNKNPEPLPWHDVPFGRLMEACYTRETMLQQDVYCAAFVSCLRKDIQLTLYPG